MSKRNLRGFNFERLEDRRLLAADCGVEIIHCCNVAPVETCCQVASVEVEDGAIDGEFEELHAEESNAVSELEESPCGDGSGPSADLTSADADQPDQALDDIAVSDDVMEATMTDTDESSSLELEPELETEVGEQEVQTVVDEDCDPVSETVTEEQPADVPPLVVDSVETIKAETVAMECDIDLEVVAVSEELVAEETSVPSDTVGDAPCEIEGETVVEDLPTDDVIVPPVDVDVVETIEAEPATVDCDAESVAATEAPVVEEIVSEEAETPGDTVGDEDCDIDGDTEMQEKPSDETELPPVEVVPPEAIEEESEMIACEATVEPTEELETAGETNEEVVDEVTEAVVEEVTEEVVEEVTDSGDSPTELPPVDNGSEELVTSELEGDCVDEIESSAIVAELAAEATELGDPVLGTPGFFGEIDEANPSHDLMFTPSESGTVDLVLASSFGEAETRVDITDGNGELIAGSMTEDLSGFQRLTFDVDANETYLITVSSDQSGEGFFMVTVDFELAPEPVPADIHADVVGETATILEVTDGVVGVQSELETAADSDAFRFQATADGEMRLDMTTVSEDHQSNAVVSVFNPEGDLMISGTTNEEVAIRFDTVSGVEYQVLVDSQNDVPAQYSLNGTLFADVEKEVDLNVEEYVAETTPSEDTVAAELDFFAGNESDLDDEEFDLVDDIFEEFGDDELVDTEFSRSRPGRGRGFWMGRS